MAILILDLDLTVICEEGQENVIDQSTHSLHPTKVMAQLDISLDGHLFQFLPISIINPVEISTLIEEACKEHDGIIILTAGCWSETAMKKVLKDQLNVSDHTKSKIDQCIFLNPVNTLNHFPHLTSSDIRMLDKIERFQQLLQKVPSLNNHHFVFLDDSERHINSFASEPKVTAITATPHLPKKYFYQDAINALARAKRRELGEPITPEFHIQPMDNVFAYDSEEDYDFAPLASYFRPDSAPVTVNASNAFFSPPRISRSRSLPVLFTGITRIVDTEFETDSEFSLELGDPTELMSPI